MSKINVDDLWEKYWAGEDSVKFELLEFYLPVVERVATSVHKNLSQSVDVFDIINDGVFGLLEAIERFDNSEGFKFETYAVSRIRGEIYDQLRVADWVPRSMRSKAKKIEKSIDFLEQTNSEFTKKELSEHTGLSEQDIEKIYSKVFAYSKISLNIPVQTEDSEIFSIYDLVEDFAIETEDRYNTFEFMDVLSEKIELLPGREKIVFCLYYKEKFTLQQIGELLKITESRVCQIHNRSLELLYEFCIGN